jgi:hypothetical protein
LPISGFKTGFEPTAEATVPGSWQQKISALRGSGLILDLPTLIALARTHTLAPEELESIRKAWVVRELQAQQPQLKKQRAETLYEEERKKLGF